MITRLNLTQILHVIIQSLDYSLTEKDGKEIHAGREFYIFIYI